MDFDGSGLPAWSRLPVGEFEVGYPNISMLKNIFGIENKKSVPLDLNIIVGVPKTA